MMYLSSLFLEFMLALQIIKSLPLSDSCNVDCAIIGGGPAGLATSIALSKSSPQSTIAIFERDNFEPKGASIQISKPGWISINKLDSSIVSKLEDASVPVTDVEIKSWHSEPNTNTDLVSGEELETDGSRGPSKPARAVINRIHLWHDVRIIFANRACELYEIKNKHRRSSKYKKPIGLLNANCILVGIRPLLESDDEGYRFELTFNDANNNRSSSSSSDEEKKITVIKAKYLFACDGTKSQVRAILPNEPDVLLAENKSVWRGMAPTFNTHGKATFYRGTSDDNTAGRSALLFPGGKGAGASWTVISDIEDGKSTSINEARERALKVIETMAPGGDNCNLFTNIIQNSNTVIENKLHARDFDQPWESSYDGLIYVGDAAHPVRPTGQGTALAFEDAAVLYQIVLDHGGLISVDVLRKYENERFLPVKEISDMVRSSADAFYSSKHN